MLPVAEAICGSSAQERCVHALKFPIALYIAFGAPKFVTQNQWFTKVMVAMICK